MSRSYANLLDLSGDAPLFTKPMMKPSKGSIPRSMTATGALVDSASRDAESNTSDAPSSISQERLILVANMLPLHAERNESTGGWSFRWDEDALLLQMKDGIPEDMEVLYVGSLKVDVEQQEQDDVAATLLDKFNCVPTFLSQDLKSKFYHGFCKQQLWPLFHYMLPLSPGHGGRFDRELWQAYVSANKIFADKVMEIISPDDDFVWVHDYHLMVLPTFLRKRFNRVRLGFFLHCPFPSSEIYRTLPVRDEILRALLNADLLGFHTFDYARHFLSCCSRMLGLEYESKRGYIGLDYYGRTVGIKIMPVGVHMGQLASGLASNDTEWRRGELRAQFEGKTLLLGVDDMDIFKGIGLKLLAMELLLRQHPEWVGKAVLVQIANPARGKGREVTELQEEATSITSRINREFGRENYSPVVLMERPVPQYERLAFYCQADCLVVTAVRDGMNLTPYEYIVSRQGGLARGAGAEGAGQLQQQLLQQPAAELKPRSVIVVSEFIGCSPSLSGAIRINPWNVQAVADALNSALTQPRSEQVLRHEKHFKYVREHHVGYWAQSFLGDLQRTCREHGRLRCYGIGFGLGFRTVALDPNFRKLQNDFIVRSYNRTTSRLILLDYDGTMMPQTSLNKTPSSEVLELLNKLCDDPRNVVFIVSGRQRHTLDEWFSSCPQLGIAAEHGYFYRWNRSANWLTLIPSAGGEGGEGGGPDPLLAWKEVALPILETYTESTDGSSMEVKESALVWHHRDADPDFGSWQAKELLDHLESVLANEHVAVTSGHHIVEVKPQGVSKGVVVERILSFLAQGPRQAPPDFVLCVGDDRSDEDMFARIESTMRQSPQSTAADVFACTVGQKPSKARYYLDDPSEVLNMLRGLATVPHEGVGGRGGEWLPYENGVHRRVSIHPSDSSESEVGLESTANEEAESSGTV